jgi:uncharacterized protein YecE (DUF72 family)
MVRIGTSGWSYDHWQGLLYPERTPVGKRLPYYLERYDTVEINATYYRWPAETTFKKWAETFPEGFTAAVKASRGISHFARLNNPERWLSRMEAGLLHLGPKLGPLLVQLPGNFARNVQRLDDFLGKVPEGIRVAMELRHPSWDDEAVYEVLERRRAAYCVMSGPGLDCLARATTDLAYVRFHGSAAAPMYQGGYTEDELREWAEIIHAWRGEGRAVFAYFNNDAHGWALRNADRLREILGIG